MRQHLQKILLQARVQSILLISDGCGRHQTTVGDRGLMVLGFTKMKAEQAMRSKPVSSTLHGLCTSSCLSFCHSFSH